MPTEKEPSKSPSASSVAVAESRLAMPSGAITSSPEAFSIWTLSPKLRSASLSATFTTATPLTSERSKETAAFVSDWPAIVGDRQAGAADPQEVAAGRGVDGDLHRRRVEGDARQAHVDRAAERPGDAGRADVSEAFAFETETMPPASESDAPLTVTFVVVPARSIVTSPASCWPSTRRTTPVPESRRYDVAGDVGAGSASVCEMPPTEKVSLTAACVEFSDASEPRASRPGSRR